MASVWILNQHTFDGGANCWDSTVVVLDDQTTCEVLAIELTERLGHENRSFSVVEYELQSSYDLNTITNELERW